MEDLDGLEAQPLPSRGLDKETLEAFGVKVGFDTTDPTKPAHVFFPLHSETGEVQGYKHKNLLTGKWEPSIGKAKGPQLFGQPTCRQNKKVFVTEGEFDALALYQVLYGEMKDVYKAKGYVPSVVSISNGASGAAKQMSNEMKFLGKFKEIITVFDSDEPGRRAAENVAKTLDHTVKIVELPLKDSNEMLLAGRSKELNNEVLYNSMPYEPDGIINANDAWDRYKDRKSVKCYPYPEQFKDLNDKTYGFRTGSVVTVTSGSGMGKTQFLRELKYDILKNTDFKIADIALEEDVGDTIEGLMALELNKRISLPDVKVSEKEEKKAFKNLFGEGRVELYDHFGGMNDDSLFSRIRYFATYLKCKVVVLDHLSIVISETADEGDERRRIDAVMTRLATMAKTLDIVIFLVVHLRKAGQGKSFEEGYVPTSDDLRGSAALKQLSWDIIALSRNQQEKDDRKRNTSGIHVLKCRFSGRTGQAGYTYFDETTGRLLYSDDPYAEDEFEEEGGMF